MKKIGKVFAMALEDAIAAGGTEPVMVEAFVREVALKRTAFGPAVNIQTAFVHQRPYALFRRPALICGASRCELGDILLIFKRVVGGAITDHRATFLQAKKGNRIWPIAPHQAEFLHTVNTTDFTFGKKARTMGGFDDILFTGLGWPATWAHYLCLDSPEPSLVYDESRVYTHQKGNCTPFNLENEPCPRVAKPNCVSCDGVSAFMHRFTKPAGPGLNIAGDPLGMDMVTIACKRVGLDVDPEEEWKDYFFPPEGKYLKSVKEASEGFGVILITAKGPAEEED